MVTTEVAEPEMSPPLPPTTFSAPFASPSLRWPSNKRLRCSYPSAAPSSPFRFSPSPSRSPLRRGSPSPPLDSLPPRKRAATSEESPPPPRSPPPSDRPRLLIRLPKPRREASPTNDAGEPPPTRTTTDTWRRGGEGEAAGRSLRSSSRVAGAEEGGERWGKGKRRVELWVPLSKGEVEEDFLRMTGSKPPRKCRLRRRSAGPDPLCGVFPGSWLPNRITADRYTVAEPSIPREGQI